MKYFIINTRSMTQAEKIRLYLAGNGIKSTVERVTGRGGCTFVLKIFGDRETVCPLLLKTGVSCGYTSITPPPHFPNPAAYTRRGEMR